MMVDLFSSLDGAFNFFLWAPSLLGVLMIFTHLHQGSFTSTMFNLGASTWSAKTLSRFAPFQLMLTALFMFLLSTNFIGLTPFTYSLSSDLFTMSCLALLFWLLVLISGWIYAPAKSAAHLAPQGAPLGLAPFLVLIESVSILIRPLTLTVRLMANISAGHIVLGLLANSLTAMLGSISMLPLVLLSTGYMLFEFFVCVIQAYIFSLLISLYQAEHP